MADLRTEVMAALKDCYRLAQAGGEDPWKAVQRAFPGIPLSVVASVMVEVDHEEETQWWAAIERTIDGELVKRAMIEAGASMAVDTAAARRVEGVMSFPNSGTLEPKGARE